MHKVCPSWWMRHLVAHAPVDVSALDCDFFVFSGHNSLPLLGLVFSMEGSLARALASYQSGGDMIEKLISKNHFQGIPGKFEAWHSQHCRCHWLVRSDSLSWRN